MPMSSVAVRPRLCQGVLIVEDEPDIRESLKQMLEFEGYRVWVAPDGAKGLEVLKQKDRPCLVLLDLMMPVMDGWAFAEVLNADSNLSRNPVVVVTAFADTARGLGAQRIIRKPFEMSEILSVVDRFCGKEAAAYVH